MFALFRNRLFSADVLGHFAVDTLNSSVAVLLVILAGPLELSNSQIATVIGVQIFVGALSQPLFGLLGDRVRGRPAVLAGVGLLWMAIFLTLAALAQEYDRILLFVGLMALGSGLFHPIGTVTASAAHPARAALATSIFFFGGQTGLAVGPTIGGALMQHYGGAAALVPVCALAVIPALLLIFAPGPAGVARTVRRAGSAALKTAPLIILAFVLLVALRSSVQSVYTSFLPKLFADRGWEPAWYGAITGTFIFAAAIGGVVTGELADRRGMRFATVWPLLICVPLGLVCITSASVPLTFVAAALFGATAGGQHSILVVHAQRLLPVRDVFAAGLILGFTFASGGLGTWAAGPLADQFGLPLVMEGATLLAIPAALLGLTLPGAPAAERVVA